jgi:hypothetical protein
MTHTANQNPVIRVSDDTLLVSHLAVTDRRVVDAAKAAAERGDDLATWCINVLAAGTAAVTAAGAGTDLARVDAALDRVRTDVETALHAALGRLDATVAKATDPTTGDVARAAQDAVNRLAAGVQRILTGSDALLPEASSRAVRQVTDGALAEIHRLLDGDRQYLAQLIAGDRERAAVEMAQAISAQNAHLGEVVAQLREALAAKAIHDAGASSGPRKGIVYEAQVHLLFQRLAGAAGDGGADAVGTATGTDGSRKGDIVVDLRSLPNRPRMVVEAKNRPGKAALSSGQWAEELDRSLSARNADVALGVCPVDQMPGSRQVLVIDSRRAVVAWDQDTGDDLATAVYLLMRMSAGYQRHDTAVSPAELEQHVQAVVAAIAPLDEIQRQAVACRRSAERIDAAAQALRTDLKARIDTMWSRIEEAA